MLSHDTLRGGAMKPFILLLTAGLLIAGSWDAQAQTRGRTNASKAGEAVHYRWEDEQGRVHFSDTLPAEALRQGRTVYRGGEVVRQVERTLTAEEKAAADRVERERMAAEAKAKKEQDALDLLERSYPDREAVKADFAQRKVFFSDRVVASEATISQHRRLLLGRLERAAELELEEKKVPKKLADEIKEAAGIVRQHHDLIKQANQSISQLNTEETQLLESLGW